MIQEVQDQFNGKIDTLCKRCHKKRIIKFFSEKDYSIRCGCGCEVYRYYNKDEFHKTDFYTRDFIPKRDFNKKLHEKKGFEKLGFTLSKDGKWVK